MKTPFNTKTINSVISLPKVRRIVESKLNNGEKFININFGKILETLNFDLTTIGTQYFSFVSAVRTNMLDLI